MNNITAILLATLAIAIPSCDDPDQSVSEEDQTFRSCIPDWELVEAAKIPCHMDVDTHTFYREIEAWGVDVYTDGNGCFVGNRYHKVELGDKKCYYVNQTKNCAAALYLTLTNNYMPLSIYDNDTCPYPRLWDNQGGGGGGQSPGGQQQF